MRGHPWKIPCTQGIRGGGSRATQLSQCVRRSSKFQMTDINSLGAQRWGPQGEVGGSGGGGPALHPGGAEDPGSLPME